MRRQDDGLTAGIDAFGGAPSSISVCERLYQA